MVHGIARPACRRCAADQFAEVRMQAATRSFPGVASELLHSRAQVEALRPVSLASMAAQVGDVADRDDLGQDALLLGGDPWQADIRWRRRQGAPARMIGAGAGRRVDPTSSARTSFLPLWLRFQDRRYAGWSSAPPRWRYRRWAPADRRLRRPGSGHSNWWQAGRLPAKHIGHGGIYRPGGMPIERA